MRELKTNKEKTLSILLNLFIILLLTIFNTMFFGSVLFIFKVSINKFLFPCSILFSFLTLIFINRKNWRTKEVFIPMIFAIAIIFSSIVIGGNLIDYTADGNTYHKLAIGNMKDGWNPVYEDQENFANNSNKSLWIQKYYLWGNTYAKGHYIYGASVYKIFGNIETAKSINFISLILVLILMYVYIYLKSNKRLLSILLALAFSTVPTIVTQLSTNYIDGLVFCYFFIMIFLNYLIYQKLNNNKKFEFINTNILFFLLMVVITILINIKFSSFAFAGVYSLVFFIYYIYLYIKKKNKNNLLFIKKYFISGFLSIIIGVFVIGLSTYPKNYINHGHPFYPLRGKGKVDIITTMQPVSFKNKTPIYKFLVSTFSQSENITYASKKKPKLKIPFTIHESEKRDACLVDTRMGGNGIFFSGIFIISIIALIIELFKICKTNRELFVFHMMTIILTVLLMFTLTEVWWARYFPQIFLFSIIPLLLMLEERKLKKSKLIVIILFITLFAINNAISLRASIKSSKEHTMFVNNLLNEVEHVSEKNKCNLYFYIPMDKGIYYDLKDRFNTMKMLPKNGLVDHDGEIYNNIKWKCRPGGK